MTGHASTSRVRYRTIVADPPWPIEWEASAAIGTRPLAYQVLPISEIAALPVKALADEYACNLYLWTTNQLLPEALGIVRIWGFRYRMLWTWCKNNGMGGHPRNATEHLICATRGQPRSPLDRHAAATLNWLEHPRLGHSIKPDVFLDKIEQFSEAPRLEMFARRQRIGWDTWGNEALEHVEVVRDA